MIFVQAPPYTTFVVDFIPDEKVSDLVQRIKDQYRLEFRGNWSLQDTSQSGSYLSPDVITVDDRIYCLNAWILA